MVGLLIKKKIRRGCAVADGWSDGSSHFMGLKHYWAERNAETNSIEVKSALLSLQPLVDETQLNARSMALYFVQIYSRYDSGMNIETVDDADNLDATGLPTDFPDIRLMLALTMDNASVNSATANLLKKPMIGCHAHRFNLAAKSWEKYAFGGKAGEYMKKINACMKKASTIKNAAKLKLLSKYRPITRNQTRWQGGKSMIEQFDKLYDAFTTSEIFETGEFVEVNSEQVQATLPAIGTINEFKSKMKPGIINLGKWVTQLQDEISDLKTARDLFDNVLLDQKILVGRKNVNGGGGTALNYITDFENRLAPNHGLVKFPDFERGVVKILKEEVHTMTEREQKACECLLRSEFEYLYPAEEEAALNADLLNSPTKFAARNKAKKARSDGSGEYVDCSFLQPTTCTIERLFSLCSHVFVAKRKRMEPRLLEAIVFLNVNRDWWDIKTVNDMLKGEYAEEV
jgi:hypothetical protein